MSELRNKAIETAGKFLAHRGYEVAETSWESEMETPSTLW